MLKHDLEKLEGALVNTAPGALAIAGANAAALRVAVEMATEPILFVSAGALEIIAANPALVRWIERPWNEIHGAPLQRLGEEFFGANFAQEFAQATQTDDPKTFQLTTTRGEQMETHLWRVPGATLEENDVLVLVFRSVTPATVSFVAAGHIDSLTGLANRARLFQVGREWLGQAEETRAALFLDLDLFKTINDKFGHIAGDRVLAATAVRLHGCVRPNDFVARYAGDEFVVLLTQMAGVHELDRICERVEQAVSQRVDWAGESISVSASVGAAVVGPETLTFEDLLHAADLAMYRRKATKRSA